MEVMSINGKFNRRTTSSIMNIVYPQRGEHPSLHTSSDAGARRPR